MMLNTYNIRDLKRELNTYAFDKSYKVQLVGLAAMAPFVVVN